jgi:hypothetical protein
MIERPADDTVPPDWYYEDIGGSALSGKTDHSNGVFSLTGSDATDDTTRDEYRYMYRPVEGDCTIYVRIPDVTGIDSGAWAGLVMRETLDPDSRMAQIGIVYHNNSRFSTRQEIGASATSVDKTGNVPGYLKLVRAGNMFTAYHSENAVHWKQIGDTIIIPMKRQIFLGIAVCSGDPSKTIQVSFDDLSWAEFPAPTDNLPDGWATQDVGLPQLEGSAGIEGTYTVVNGSGNGRHGRGRLRVDVCHEHGTGRDLPCRIRSRGGEIKTDAPRVDVDTDITISKVEGETNAKIHFDGNDIDSDDTCRMHIRSRY